GSSVSWSSPTRPATKELYPSRVFDRLVGDGGGRQLDRSILDEVRRDSQSLRPKISHGDNVKLNNDLSQMNFKFLEGVQGALHLDLTHNGHAADKEAMYLKTNQYHIAQFAYLTQRMKDISEGETSLLDNSILVATSSLFDGDAHSADRLPVLLTGRGGGTITPGRVPDYLDKGDEGRKACSLHLSLMDRMGVTLDKFGDATTRLAEL